MSLSEELTRLVDDAIDRERPALVALARGIHARPELRFEEHEALRLVTELLEARGHVVERGLAGMATAFRARRGDPRGPRVAVLAEYDALPEIGHACGHNLIAMSAVGAFLGAAAVTERTGGEIILLGTPAEEGGGGKVEMIDAGVFEGLDAALMFHPLDRDLLAHPTLANLWLEMSFHGRPAHAAMAPFDGKSALQACMDTFRLIDGQRVGFRDGVRVHGYVTNGGQAVNIIPSLAACELSVRATHLAELDRVRAIVERCARAAAMASDVSVEITARRGYKEMKNNMTLARRFGEHARALGRSPRETDPTMGAGSTDMGDVSHVVPSIHPWLAIVDENEALCHQVPFATAAASDRGTSTGVDAAKALARTAVELLVDAELRAEARREWESVRPSSPAGG